MNPSILKKKYIDKGITKYSLIILVFLPDFIPAGNAALYFYEQNKNYFSNFLLLIFINISRNDFVFYNGLPKVGLSS